MSITQEMYENTPTSRRRRVSRIVRRQRTASAATFVVLSLLLALLPAAGATGNVAGPRAAPPLTLGPVPPPTLPALACNCARDVVVTASTTVYSGYRLSGDGSLTAFGDAAPITGPSFGGDLARAAVERVAGGVYVLDAYGGIHATGGAPPVTPSYYAVGFDSVRDIDLRLDGSGYVLDLYGALHPFNGAPAETVGPYWLGSDLARSFVITVDIGSGVAGYILDAWGGLHPFATGNADPPPAIEARWWEAGVPELQSLIMTSPASGYVVSVNGAVHQFNAPAVDEPTFSYETNATAAAHIGPDGYGFLLQRDGTTKALVPQQVNAPGGETDHQPAQNRAASPPLAAHVQPIGNTDIEIPMPPVPAGVVEGVDLGPTVLQHTQYVNRQLFVQWALDHTVHLKESRPPRYVRMSNDCTNFVSQALDAAGWEEVGRRWPHLDYVKTKKWFFSDKYRGAYSFTWAVANDFGLMLAATGWAKPVVNWSKVQVGDILQIDDGRGRAFHTMIVTERDPGSTGRDGIKLTYHESAEGIDYVNEPLHAIIDRLTEGTDLTSEDVRFYGWRLYSIDV